MSGGYQAPKKAFIQAAKSAAFFKAYASFIAAPGTGPRGVQPLPANGCPQNGSFQAWGGANSTPFAPQGGITPVNAQVASAESVGYFRGSTTALDACQGVTPPNSNNADNAGPT